MQAPPAALSSPRPFAAVDDAVAILVEVRPVAGVPIFLVAEIAVVVGVEGGPARLVLRLLVAVVEAAAVPAIGIFGAADAAVVIGVPHRESAGAVIVIFGVGDAAVAVAFHRTVGAAGGIGACRLVGDGIRDRFY